MKKTLQKCVLSLFLLSLSACATHPPSMESPLILPPSPIFTDPPAISIASTPLPSPTITETPVPTATPGIPSFTDDSLKNRIDQLAAIFIQQNHSSGLSVAVVKRNPQTGQLDAMLLNYGKTSKEHGQPITSDTVYEIGSITKVFTGILLAQTVYYGIIQLNDPVQKY